MAFPLIALAAPPLLFFLPGALFLRLVRARRESPLPRDFVEWLFLSALGSFLSASWIGLALAELSLFSLRALLAAQCLISLPLLLAAPRSPWGIPPPRAGGLAWAALYACLGLALFTPPYEYALGNWDPGTYIVTGARLARTGSIAYRDPLLASLPPAERALFYFTHLIPQRYEGGMAIGDHEGAVVSPHFYHLYTVWIAVFNALGGLRLSLWANPLLGLLSLAAFALAAREIAGGRTASLASLFLAASAAQIWCVRFPSAEIAAQFLLFSGLFCLFRAIDDGDGAWALLAGTCFAEALLALFTAALALPALLLISAAWDWRGRRRAGLLLLLPMAAGLLHLAIQDMTVCRPYCARQFEVFRSVGLTAPRLAAAGAAFLIALAAGAFAVRNARGRAARALRSPAFRVSLGAAVAALFVYAYFFRPFTGVIAAARTPRRFAAALWTVAGSALSAASPPGVSPDLRNLREFGWFVYPLPLGPLYIPAGLILALGGALLFIRDGIGGKRGAFLLVALPVCAFLLFRKFIFPSYPWAARRFMPLAFPAAVLLMAYPLGRLAGRRGAGGAAAAAVALLLLSCMRFCYAGHVRPTDYAGMVEFLSSMARRLDRGGIYVCEGSGMAAPLDCVYGIDILQLSGQDPRKCRAVERVMLRWLALGRRVYYISRGGWPLSAELDFVPAGSIPLITDHLEQRVGAFPTRRVPVEITARLFRVTALGGDPEAGRSRRVIDIGEDAFCLLDGFHAPVMRWERGRGKPVRRWARCTGGMASLLIPTFGSRGDLQVVMRAAAGGDRPGGGVPAVVSAGGREIATVLVGPSMGEYRFTVPASVLPHGRSRAAIEIRSPVRQARSGESPGPREIGICIDKIEVSRAPDPEGRGPAGAPGRDGGGA